MLFTFKVLLLFIMIFCHLIDDYKIQGILANMKQKRWWQKNYNHHLYKNDYKIALIEHAFSWSFMITLPLLFLAFYQENVILGWIIIISYFTNTIGHAIIDNEKANNYSINLITDQILHLFQIIFTWIIACAAI